LHYTERAVKVFLSTGTRFPRRIVWAMGLVKYAAARANTELGLLSKDVGDAIARASMELAEGIHDGEVVVDVFQTGSGTGLNMNVNEVIALRASELCGRAIHPNDHVNLGQSTNDVVPTAIRVAALAEVRDNLLPALNTFINSLEELSGRVDDVIKPGRTHLRDALPVTMGMEFRAFLDAFKHDLTLINNVLQYVRELPIGGTAVGTGLNTHPKFPELVVAELRSLTGLDLVLAESKSRCMRLLSDLVALSGVLRVVAVDIYRLCQDLRLMYSGPFTGLNEVDIPQEVAGSSIMPGKENPVTVEAAMLASAQVMGLDQANNIAGMLGEFELSMGIPLIGYNIITQLNLLSESLRKLSTYVLSRLVPNRGRAYELAERSQALITVVTPLIGYDRAAQASKELLSGKPLRQVLKELGLTDEEVDRVLNLKELIKPGIRLSKLHHIKVGQG